MAESGSKIYIVHGFGGEWEDSYDFVEAAFTTLPAAVAHIEHVLGAYEQEPLCFMGSVSRVWRRWKLMTLKGDEYEYWGPWSDDEEDDEEEDDDFEPSHPFDYVFVPDEFESFEIKSIVLDSGAYEQDVPL